MTILRFRLIKSVQNDAIPAALAHQSAIYAQQDLLPGAESAAAVRTLVVDFLLIQKNPLVL